MKIVIICAEGSMGKSLISSLLEKFNFINLVVRKRYLNEYVTEKRLISDMIFKDRTLVIAKELSNPDVSGGLGVVNAINDKKTIKIDIEKIQEDLNKFYKNNYKNLDEMFFESMCLFNKATIYKNNLINPVGAIENSKNISKFEFKEIYAGYKKHFKDFYFIFLNRGFISWINSIASQIISKNFLNLFKYRMRLSSQVQRHKKWQNIYKDIDKKILKIDFDDFFDEKRLSAIIKKVSTHINENEPNINFKNENFDCFGYMASYEKAFKKIDDQVNFLSNFSKKVSQISYNSKSKFFIFFLDIIFQISFLIDVINFKIKRLFKVI